MSWCRSVTVKDGRALVQMGMTQPSDGCLRSCMLLGLSKGAGLTQRLFSRQLFAAPWDRMGKLPGLTRPPGQRRTCSSPVCRCERSLPLIRLTHFRTFPILLCTVLLKASATLVRAADVARYFFGLAIAMPASGGDVTGHKATPRVAPSCDIGKLLVTSRAAAKGKGHGQAKRLRALEVDDEFVYHLRRAGQCYCLQ